LFAEGPSINDKRCETKSPDTGRAPTDLATQQKMGVKRGGVSLPLRDISTLGISEIKDQALGTQKFKRGLAVRKEHKDLFTKCPEVFFG